MVVVKRKTFTYDILVGKDYWEVEVLQLSMFSKAFFLYKVN